MISCKKVSLKSKQTGRRIGWLSIHLYAMIIIYFMLSPFVNYRRELFQPSHLSALSWPHPEKGYLKNKIKLCAKK